MSRGITGTLAATSYLLVPREPAGIGCLVPHGSGQDARDWTAGVFRQYANALCRSGRHVLIGDFGGEQTYGNDASLTSIEAGYTLLQTYDIAAEVDLLPVSMGNLLALRFALAHPAQVRKVAALIPLVDIVQFRADDELGAASDVEAAWEIAPEDPIPTRGIPFDNDYGPLAWHGWYSTGDTVVHSEDAVAFAAQVGATATSTDFSDADHPTALNDLDFDDVIEWLEAA